MKVAIVVGHRKHKQGAFGNGGLSEFEYNSILAKDLVKKLKKDGVDAKIFYRKDLNLGYGELMRDLHQRIDKWGAKYSLSLHFNDASTPLANGHEVLYCSKKGRELALKLDANFDKYLKNRDRNIKRRRRKNRGGGFLCRGKSIAVIAEPFFASHQRDFLKGRKKYKKLLKAYRETILELK